MGVNMGIGLTYSDMLLERMRLVTHDGMAKPRVAVSVADARVILDKAYKEWSRIYSLYIRVGNEARKRGQRVAQGC